MELLVDGQQTGVIGAFANLEDILARIASDQDGKDRVVWSVKLNGKNYSETVPHDSQGIIIDDIRSLEIDTMDRTEIVQDFLRNGGNMVEILYESAKKISGIFRKADEKEANKHYAEFIDLYRNFFYMLQQSVDTLGIDFDTTDINGSSVNERLMSQQKLFDHMIHIQEQEDWIILADLLEYELAPILREFGGIFQTFKDINNN